MKINKKDRILLLNQYKILDVLDKENSQHYRELIEILENGYEIFYSMVDEWVSEDMPASEGKFVLRVLGLYRMLENFKQEVPNSKVISHVYSYFRGFDGNNESEYMAFCRFLIEKQYKFQEQRQYFIKNDNMNSHTPMIPKYSRMLAVAEDLDENLDGEAYWLSVLDA